LAPDEDHQRFLNMVGLQEIAAISGDEPSISKPCIAWS
jgi:hypothetical protein